MRVAAGSGTAAFGGDGLLLVCLEVRDRVYALDVSQVREVVRWQPVTPLPKAPALIEGVIDLRGTVVPVVDLGRALGGDPIEVRPTARIAVVEAEGLVLGLAVDAAVEVVGVDFAVLDEPPALVTQAGYDAARAVVRRPGEEPIVVLSLDHVLESVFRSEVAA